MSTERFLRFGNYLLLERIATGGMAEIFLSRPEATSANGRVVIIKRILPHIGEDSEFLKMFRSEINVCMGLSHPQIVQIYDFGEADRQPYMALEYVEGRSLRQVMTEFQERGFQMPVPMALSIAAQTASGLHYAHNFENVVTGTTMNLVHRDVSPQNVLVSYVGNVKIIDFGIAKVASDASDRTRAGIIKGKVCYLSPEQIGRGNLDGRTDVFALGIVLWEMLTGQKLFSTSEEDDFTILKMIKDSDKHVRPPSDLRKELPAQIDRIVMKALANRPEDRYATAADFQKDLRSLLILQHPGYGYSDLAETMATLFQERIVEDRKRLKDLNTSAQTSLLGQARREQTRPILSPESAEASLTSTPADLSIHAQAAEAAYRRAQSTASSPKRRISIGHMAMAAFYLLTIAALKIDQNTFFLEQYLPWGDTSRTGLVIREALNRRTYQLRPKSSRAFASTPVSTPSPHENRIWLKIILIPKVTADTRIFVNNQKIDTRSLTVSVPMDSPLSLTIDRPGFQKVKKNFVLKSSQLQDKDMTAISIPLQRKI